VISLIVLALVSYLAIARMDVQANDDAIAEGNTA